MSDLYSILAEWYPEGKYTEADLWEAIAEAEGVDINEIMDRDLIEFIYFNFMTVLFKELFYWYFINLNFEHIC